MNTNTYNTTNRIVMAIVAEWTDSKKVPSLAAKRAADKAWADVNKEFGEELRLLHHLTNNANVYEFVIETDDSFSLHYLHKFVNKLNDKYFGYARCRLDRIK